MHTTVQQTATRAAAKHKRRMYVIENSGSSLHPYVVTDDPRTDSLFAVDPDGRIMRGKAMFAPVTAG